MTSQHDQNIIAGKVQLCEILQIQLFGVEGFNIIGKVGQSSSEEHLSGHIHQS